MKKNIIYNIAVFLSLVFFQNLNAQLLNSNSLIQLSGLTVCENGIGEPTALAYVEIAIKNTSRGTFSDEKGFFSLAVQRGDTILFHYLGYKQAVFIVPDSFNKVNYSIIQILTRDEIVLPQTVVYPWPSKEHFKQEFLNMDVHERLYDIAQQNLAKETIQKLMELTPPDGRESTSLYLRQQATKEYYRGQFQPMKILSPMAWIEFFKAWKRGDFKRKK